MNDDLLAKLERLGIAKALKLFPKKGIGSTAGALIGGSFGGPGGAALGGAAGEVGQKGLEALQALLMPQQMPFNPGYNPEQQMESPGGMQEQQNMLQQLLQGGAQGLGNYAGNALGQAGNNALFGQGGNSIQQILEMIPEEELMRYLESRQMNRGM